MNHPIGNSPHGKGRTFDFSKFNIFKLAENQYTIPCPSPTMRLPINSFFFLYSGELYIEIGSESLLLHEGEMIIIPTNTPMSIKYYNKTVGYMGGFSSELISDLPLNSANNFSFLHYCNVNQFSITGAKFTRVSELCENLITISSQKSENNKLLHSYLVCLFQELKDISEEKVPTTHNNILTHKFIDLLFKNDNLEAKPADYAKKLSVSVNHLNKTIRLYTSKSVSQWIEERLIVHAKILLRDPKLSIAEISEQLGITDQSYFARKFKQYVGISASDYRKHSI